MDWMQYHATVVTHKPNLKETEMKTVTIKTPNFTRRIASITAEIRTIACIDDVDAEVIEKILQDALTEECRMLDGYYAEEYYNEIASSYVKGYTSGYDDGHSGSPYAV